MSEKESLGSVKTRVAVLLGVGAIRYTSYNISYAIFYVKRGCYVPRSYS